MRNSYSDIDTDIEKLLHEVARLHVHLGRMANENISTRGWTYNELVSGILALSCHDDMAVKQFVCIDVLFDTFDAYIEIGKDAIKYLDSLGKL